MKIFGKRKSIGDVASSAYGTGIITAAAARVSGDSSNITLSAESENEDVPSYFAQTSSTNDGSPSKKKKQRHDDISSQQPNGDDIQALLAMDPSKLNSKQRRLVRRHQEREDIEKTNVVESAEKKRCNASSSSIDEEQIASQGSNGDKNVKTVISNQQEAASTTSATTTTTTTTTTTEILAKLEGLNSKDRRKFLRQLRSSVGGTIDESVIAAAEDQARKVAERNEQEAVQATIASDKASKTSKAKVVSGEKSTRGDHADMIIVDDQPTNPKCKRRKKYSINIDDLEPKERKRREVQRIMQKEAANRRASGLVDPDRHPLNSERRRANRRKPGKAAKIVQAKKEQLVERGKFNAVGYQMRKKGGT